MSKKHLKPEPHPISEDCWQKMKSRHQIAYDIVGMMLLRPMKSSKRMWLIGKLAEELEKAEKKGYTAGYEQSERDFNE